MISSYLDALVKKIKEKEESIERWLAIAKLSQERAAEAVAEAFTLKNKAQIIVKRNRELQEEVSLKLGWLCVPDRVESFHLVTGRPSALPNISLNGSVNPTREKKMPLLRS